MTVPFRSKESALAVLNRLRPATTGLPTSAMIQIADRCNEVCVHCYQIQGQKGEIETTDWQRLLDELAEMGVLLLTVSGGEATLRSDLLDILRHARERKFLIKLFTNALRIDAAMADALAELAIHEVQISLYGPTADVHDWVTNVPGSFDKVVEATKLLRARGVAVVLKSAITSFNFDSRFEYVELARSLDADYMFDPTLHSRDDGDRGPQQFALTPEQLRVLREDATFSRVGAPPPQPDPEQPLCGACQSNVQIDSRGVVQPCTLLGVDLGSARENGVKAAWKSEAAERIRGLRWRDIKGCRDCDLRAYCSRCFAASRHESGDALGPYETACSRALLQYELAHGAPPVVTGDARVGPYVQVGDGFEAREAVETEHDRQIRRELAWARAQGSATPDLSGPGDLVQIRRPGKKREQAERIPTLPGGAVDPV